MECKSEFISDAKVREFASQFPTPFYLYDENRIRVKCRQFKKAFSWADGFTNFFAVKATPNPTILKILLDEEFGADCSSLAELALVENAGFNGNQIYFTSNNTPLLEFQKAMEMGASINLDDISHIDFLNETIGLPEFLSFRYNPGATRSGNSIIGEPSNSKFGLTRNQIFEAYKKSQSLGVKKFGLHSMVLSNCLDEHQILENANMIFTLALDVFDKTGIKIEVVNLGGGIGIPYKPDDKEFDIGYLSKSIEKSYSKIISGTALQNLRIVFECGRYITGPSGVLITRIIHQKNTYKQFIGVDACMANLMRPAMYNAYHHITIVKDDNPEILKHLPKERNIFVNKEITGIYDIVGSLCENNDKFAIDRYLGPNVEIGDVLIIHDTGAHGHSMGFNYNGKLKCAEYLIKSESDEEPQVIQIRRAETLEDHFITLC